MNLLRRIHTQYRTIVTRLHSRWQLRETKRGSNNNVFGEITIIDAHRVEMGDDCSFNHGCYINACNGLELGNDVTMSANVSIITTGIDYHSWIAGKKRHTSDKKVIIGNHVWLGANAMVLPGVSIMGEYVVVAANAVVTHDIKESKCIYAGIPAKKIRDIH